MVSPIQDMGSQAAKASCQGYSRGGCTPESQAASDPCHRAIGSRARQTAGNGADKSGMNRLFKAPCHCPGDAIDQRYSPQTRM